MCRWPNCGCADIPERCEVEARRHLTPAARLKERIVAKREQDEREQREVEARVNAQNDTEARKILASAKAYMEEKFSMSYEPTETVCDSVYKRLDLLCKAEGFRLKQRWEEFGYIAFAVEIP